jgi:hypothetical protein
MTIKDIDFPKPKIRYMTTSQAVGRMWNAIDPSDVYYLRAFDHIVDQLNLAYDKETGQWVTKDTGDSI